MTLKREGDTELTLRWSKQQVIFGQETIDYFLHEVKFTDMPDKLRKNLAELVNRSSMFEPDTSAAPTEDAYGKDYTVPPVKIIPAKGQAANDHLEKDEEVKAQVDKGSKSNTNDVSGESEGTDVFWHSYLNSADHKGAHHDDDGHEKVPNASSRKGAHSKTGVSFRICSENQQLDDFFQNFCQEYLLVQMTQIWHRLLARKYCIGGHSDLSPHRLRRSLPHLPTTIESSDNIVSVIETVYQEARSDNELSTLLVQHIVANMDWLMPMECFRSLLGRDPQLCFDFWRGLP